MLSHCKAIATLAFLFCVVSSQARAQDFRQTLLDMRDGYGRLEKFHAVMTIQVFEDEKSKAPFYKEQAEVKKDSQDYFYSFDDTEMMLNGNYMIAVNHSLKQIIWSPRDVKAQQAFMTPLPLNIDSVLTFYEAPLYKGSENGIEHYVIKQKGNLIRQIDMYLDVQTHFIRKLEYRYTDGQYMITTFEKFETQPVFNDKTFSESRYWSKDGGGQRANAAFAGYTITEAPQSN